MPITRTRKLYPTPDNCQHSNDSAVPLQEMLDYFHEMIHNLSPSEAATVELHLGQPGPTGFALYFREELDDQQVQAAKHQALLDALQAARGNGAGLSPDDIEALLKRVNVSALFPSDGTP